MHFIWYISVMTAHKEASEITIAKRVIEAEVTGLQSIASIIDENFVDVIHSIADIKGRIIVTGIGKSGIIAKKFVATMASTGTPSFFIHPVEAIHGDLGMITEDDILILISNSGESPELAQVIEYCKRYGIHMVGICRNPNSSLVKACDKNIVLPNIAEASALPAPTTSTTMTLAICDAIAVVLSERKGFTHADFKVFHPGGSIGAQLQKAKDLMHKDDELPIVKSGVTVSEAILEITKKRFGCVAIIDSTGDMLGVLTDGDLRRHLDHDYRVTIVDDVMTKNPTSAKEEMYAAEILHMLEEKKITNCFVLNGKKPIGILHIHDLLKAKVV